MQDDPDLAPRVSNLLPAYRDSGAGWLRAFAEEHPEIAKVEFGGGPADALEASLTGLSEVKPQWRMRARRLFAIAAAGRAFPDLKDQNSDMAALAQNALAVEGIGGGEQAAGLLALLVDDEIIGTSEDENFDIEAWWEDVLTQAEDNGFIGNAAEFGPHPCTGGLVWVDVNGSAEPAVTLQTAFETELPFASVVKFCDPEEWTCFPFWCDMTPVGDAQHVPRRYHEIVSLDCDHKAETWTVEVDLDFVNTVEPDVLAVTEYRLTDGLPQEQVLVNEGSLVVTQLGADDGSRVKLETTKRLKFAGSFDGPAFASVLCHLGYLGYVEDLLSCAAKEDDLEPNVFPGRRPARREAQTAADGADDDFRGLTGFTIKQVAATAENFIDECAEALKVSYEKIGKGEYSADVLIQDMADAWVRMVGEGAAFADAGLRIVRTTPAPPRGGSSAGPAQAEEYPAPGATQTAIGEVIEDCTELAKDLTKKWSDYASGVATKLEERSYDADTAAADLATAVSLGIESGARLAWEAVDAVTILTGGLDKPHIVESDPFATTLAGAALKLKGNLVSGFGYTLRTAEAEVVPSQLGPNDTSFVLRVDATNHPAGTYWGKVEASTRDGGREEVNVRITIP